MEQAGQDDGRRDVRADGRADDRADGSADGRVRTVVVTGGAGRIGTYLRRADGGLAARGWRLRLLDVTAPDELREDEIAYTADLSDEECRDALDGAMTGADAVVHLAGIPTEDTWTRVRRANIDGTYRVLESARRCGVRRVVLASSNHAVGFYPTDAQAPVDAAPRPDSYYGVSKVAVEALGSLYADRYGLAVVSLRIGLCTDGPGTTFDLGIWLSPADAVRLVHAALTGPVGAAVGAAGGATGGAAGGAAGGGQVVAYGISANTRAWWDLTSARALGYEPRDDAEVFADRVVAYEGPPGVLGHGMVDTDPHAATGRRP
ncbi:NAD-dependent dehydratase [Cellulomonas marina]|uniref:Uronate dehydrogenase n=1 Tax=Cellulomonas marina TaxID=988821 RepID=A0A1I1AQL9_9CELL|nr:NAD-dependent dehydratase [Cellulomonas marina]SFB38633.1 uronate dehydrogenase [Cellulomonas marina]